MIKQVEGGVASPKGFKVGVSQCGIKPTTSRNDVALLVSESDAVVAGLFTTNLVRAAPVQWSEKIVHKKKPVRALLLNSGNANACTGAAGAEATKSSAQAVAELIHCNAKQVLVASTGVIGVPFPIDRLLGGIPTAGQSLAAGNEASHLAARAIMTTDTFPKECAVNVTIGAKTYTVGGMAKGAGMIHPNMATLFGIITTDAPLSAGQAQRIFAPIVQETFNAITIDGDTSTNDCAMLFANGAAGGRIVAKSRAEKQLTEAIAYVCQKLAEAVATDGEGAKKLLVIKVTGAKTQPQALQVARTVASSALVKTAVAGGDPNWGRVLAAAGRADVPLRPEHLELQIGGHCVAKKGMAQPAGEAGAAEHLQGKRIEMELRIGKGKEQATVYGCDLTEGYVEINGHYRT